MINKAGKDLAVLDANVLYGNFVRHVLLTLAEHEVYIPIWTERIQDEWSCNLVKKIPELGPATVRVKELMAIHFKGSLVTDYEEIESTLSLPDPADRHVLAAAIKSEANVIVTENIKDYPPETAASYEIEIMTADEFLVRLINQNKYGVIQAFFALTNGFKNPPLSAEDVFNKCEQRGLKESVQILRNL